MRRLPPTGGEGLRYGPVDTVRKRQRYLFPPLWGSDSYNDAAGMSRSITAAWFVRANMPRGITFAYPSFLGPFPPQQRELGPWQPIETWLRQKRSDNRQDPRAAGDLEAVIGTHAGPTN